MKKLIIAFCIVLSLFITSASALEIYRQKNVASYIVFPIMKNDATLITGAAGLDSEIDTYADGAAPNGFTDCTNEATEIGSTGQYYLSLTNTELNVDYAIIQIKSSTSGAVTQTILVRTTGVTLLADQAVNVTKIVGSTVDAATAQIGVNVVNWKGSAAPAMTGDAYARLGAPAGASVSADVAAIKSDSAAILVDTAAMDTANELRTLLTGGTSAISILTATDNIGINWADVANPTTAVNLSGTNIKTDQVVASVSGAVGSVTGAVGSITGITFPTNFGVLSISATTGLVDITQAAADKAWSTAARTLTAGTNLALLTAQNVWEYATRVLTAGTNLNNISAADVVSAMQAVAGDFKADVSGLATSTDISNLQTHGDSDWATATGFSTLTAQQVWEYATRALTDKAGFSLTQTFPDNFSALVISALGKVTVGTNDDKTGYTVSTVSDKTGYSLTQSFPDNFADMSITPITGLLDITQIAADKVWGTASRALTDKAGFTISGTKTTLDALNDYAGGDTAGVTTLLERLTAIRAGYLDNLDALISSRLAASGYTTPDNTNITNIINLLRNGTGYATCPVNKSIWDYLDAAVSSRSTYAGGDTSGVTTLLGRLTDVRAGYLDAAIASRMASFTYTAPDNTGIGNIYAIVNSETHGNSALLTAIGTRAPASTALSNVTWTDAKAAFLDALISSRSTLDAAGVWGYSTRLLTAGTNIVLAKGVGITGFNDIAAGDVWGADDKVVDSVTDPVQINTTLAY